LSSSFVFFFSPALFSILLIPRRPRPSDSDRALLLRFNTGPPLPPASKLVRAEDEDSCFAGGAACRYLITP